MYVIDNLEHRLTNRHENWNIYVFFHGESFYAISFIVIHQQMALQYMFLCRKLLNYCPVWSITMKLCIYVFLYYCLPGGIAAYVCMHVIPKLQQCLTDHHESSLVYALFHVEKFYTIPQIATRWHCSICLNTWNC